MQTRDEIEQLRTALETALEENARLVDDRDRLLARVATLSRDLQQSHAHYLSRRGQAMAAAAASEHQDQSDEELRVAFEELQVLTEELEVANAGLHESNVLLDARVAERTRELHDSNAALHATETSFRSLANLVPDLLWRTDAAGLATWFNQRWFDRTGQSERAALGRGWLDAVHQMDRAVVRTSWALAVDSGASYERELRIGDAAGTYRWFLVRAELVRDDDGRPAHWFVAGADIHEHRVAIEALRHSEERFRTLVEGMPQLAWRALDDGYQTWSSPQWRDYTGLTTAESLGTGYLRAVHPDDRAKVSAAWAAAGGRGVFELESRVRHGATGKYRYFSTRAVSTGGGNGGAREWIGTATDIDDSIQLQKRQAVLVAELQHRTRNLMAVVQAVTMRTLKSSSSLAQFRDEIDDRLTALARVQGLLSRRDGGPVAFDTLLRAELSGHIDLAERDTAAHLLLQGRPGIALPSSIVQTLALALHELATNAVKYGALSQPGARLEIGWAALSDGHGERTLKIDWRERRVALPVTPPLGGYGRELIERALPYQLDARTSYAFTPDGVHCTIAVLLPEDAEQSGDIG